MSFRQLRKLPGLDGIVKDLAEKLQRAQADQGVEDVTLFRQNRVDHDGIAYTDAATETLDGDQAGTDAVALSDSEESDLAGAGTFRIAEGKDRVLLWLRLDGDATDYSGNGLDGTITGTLADASGRIRHGKTFTGSEHITTPYNVVLDQNHIGWHAYIRPSEVGNNHYEILTRRTDVGAPIVEIWINNVDATLKWLLATADGQKILTSNISLAAGSLYEISGFYNGSVMKLFIDNVEVAGAAHTGNISNPAIGYWVGALNQGGNPGFRFRGMIDDVRVYTILNASELANLGNTPLFGGSIYDPPLCAGYGDVAA